jgi:outer membrane immunogenic protein
MRKVIFALLAATVLSPAGSQYALAASATYNWSGWYIGLNAGGNWGESNNPTSVGVRSSIGGSAFNDAQVAAINAAAATSSVNTSGFTGGVQGGYNWQTGNLVAGVELDFQYFRSEGQNTISGIISGGSPFTITSSVSTDWLFTTRPRLGVASGNWLLYGTGGVAVTRIKASWDFSSTLSGSTTESASVSSTKTGWIVGGGVETALPGNLSLGVEYLYVRFGSVSASSPNFTSPANINGILKNPVSHSADLRSDIVRARLSKKF